MLTASGQRLVGWAGERCLTATLETPPRGLHPALGQKRHPWERLHLILVKLALQMNEDWGWDAGNHRAAFQEDILPAVILLQLTLRCSHETIVIPLTSESNLGAWDLQRALSSARLQFRLLAGITEASLPEPAPLQTWHPQTWRSCSSLQIPFASHLGGSAPRWRLRAASSGP